MTDCAYVSGNKELLQCDETWGKFVRHYENCGCIKLPEEFPPKTVRHEQTSAAILRSERKYGDERFEKVDLGPLGPYIPAPGEEEDGSDGGEDLGPLGPYIPAPGDEEDNSDGGEDYDLNGEEEPSMISRFRSLGLQQRTNNYQRQSQIDTEGWQRQKKR